MLSSVFLFFWCRGPESNRYGCFQPRDFKSRASASSATSAEVMEATPGIEPGIKVLQTSALPLGYVAIFGAGNEARTRDPLLGKEVLYHWAIPAKCGASAQNRTVDTGIFSPLLYQLSYRGIVLATRKGLEPSTSAVTGRHSNQLNHRAKSTTSDIIQI